MVVAALVVAVVVLDQPPSAGQQRLDIVARFDAAWTRGNYRGMYAELRATARRRISLPAFEAAYRGAARTAGLAAITFAHATVVADRVVVPARVATRVFGVIGEPVSLTVSLTGGDRGIVWSGRDRFPGLRGGEQLGVRLVAARRGAILAGNGALLSPTRDRIYPLGGAGELIAGEIGRSAAGLPVGVSGLEQVYNAILAGTPGRQLRFGTRLVAASVPRAGETVRTTIDPPLQQTATAALGGRYGAIAVVRPSTGAVLALAGVALSSAQPPGSTFKIITATAALQGGFASLASSYPLERSTTIDGYTLHNAGGEACGGTLLNAFAVSCNSVFVPLGARLGAVRLVATADAYGFNRTPRVAGELPSTLPGAAAIGDALAVGSSAIGQGRVLATPLEMASVAATVANGGVRARPRLLASLPVTTQRVTSTVLAGELRKLMLAVVTQGTGTAVEIPGVPVAAKTGTAELANGPSTASDPSNTDAWFVAFPAVPRPPVAVAVMLVRDGAGGQTAAPLARQVLLTALREQH
jgi:cell division protein FtsI/penicillin-binding protein 2